MHEPGRTVSDAYTCAMLCHGYKLQWWFTPQHNHFTHGLLTVRLVKFVGRIV